MLVPKKQYKDMELTFKAGVATFTIKTNDITQEKIDSFRNHIDLSHYVELEAEEVPEQYLDIQDSSPRVEETKEAPKPTTIKKTRKTNKK